MRCAYPEQVSQASGLALKWFHGDFFMINVTMFGVLILMNFTDKRKQQLQGEYILLVSFHWMFLNIHIFGHIIIYFWYKVR